MIAPFGLYDKNFASITTILDMPPPIPALALPAPHLSSSTALMCCAWELARKGLIRFADDQSRALGITLT
jgi:hypothetical protein